MTDETTSEDMIRAIRYANAKRLCPSIMDKLAEAESNEHGITICDEQDREPIVIFYEELPHLRAFLERDDQPTP